MPTTIIVEDGSEVTGANSYVTAAELLTYATNRGLTITAVKEDLLTQAMDYLETLNFLGYRVTSTQSLKFPRSGLWYDGYPIDYDEIPNILKKGQMETALAIDAGNGPMVDIPRSTKREKVGPIEVEYMDGASSVVTVRKINAMLAPLLNSGSSGSWNFNVGKA